MPDIDMRTLIEEVEISQGMRGLSGCKIERLSEVVVLTGPNGGGKSRLLRIIADKVREADNWAVIQNNITSARKQTQDERSPMRGHLQNQILQWERQLKESPKFTLQTGVSSTSILAIYFAPKIDNYNNPGDMTITQLQNFLDQGGRLNLISGNFQHTLYIIQSLVLNYLNSLSPQSGYPEGDVENLRRKYQNLDRLLTGILGMSLTWEAGPKVSIGGTPLEHITSQFSQGQKWLLHFIASTFSDITLDDPMVLCLDEPELHLHPAALNQVVDILKSTLSNGQLLIATHSIPLIAHVGYDKVWYVADGNISYAGRQPEKVINGLVGGMDGVMKLVELLTEPSAAAVAKFALESLSPPTVVGARDDDPQAEQIIRSVKTKSAALGRPIRLLDYGAGKGRFLDIAAHVLESDVDGLIDYHAYDPSAANAEICRSAIARVYGEGVGTRYFTKKSEIPEVVAGANFDVVLLSNVLHEIAPVDWLKELAFIRDILVPDGEMLIVEDLQLPQGEHAHNEGFVIASREAFRKLFAVGATELRETKASSPSMLDRLMCVAVPARVIGQASGQTVFEAVSYIRDQAKRRIQEIRDQSASSFRSGMLHALYLHQFANSSLALERLSR